MEGGCKQARNRRRTEERQNCWVCFLLNYNINTGGSFFLGGFIDIYIFWQFLQPQFFNFLQEKVHTQTNKIKMGRSYL